ncbi:recombinase family protein [Ensifer adhaerens]|uniref:recombinase family protein n=1 Tax=Ensifer adhaerens TaxID=106592 RepID=UPI001C4E2CDB|nr:recombinase family protein [Ensifer adhaerens]MBW0366120.1 recombinase family protein [Ensifer adhaerens]UCM19985.1 recombinase family protein [Ensifer adhaerens]
MTKAYSYIRFSTPEQAQGDSLRRQVAKAEVWAQARGLILDDSHRDLGISAYHGANRTNGALRSFLQMVEDGKIERDSYLIVESLDRLSRETVIDAATQLFALIQAGVVVVTLSDGQEYSATRLRQDWTPLVISLAVMARAHDESRVKSERVGEAWRQKKAAARTEGKPITPRCPEWLEVRDGKFIERSDRVEIVRRIFRETIEGFGRREIVCRLNGEKKLPFKAGEKRKKPPTGWQTSSIAKIVQNRAVIGEYQPHTGTHKARNRRPEGEPIKDYYPRIIPDDVFWRAQASLENRRQQTGGRRGDKGAHILHGLAKCSACGSPMWVVNKGKPPKGGVYLACSSNRRNVGCDNGRAWRVDELEEAVLLCLTSFKTQSFKGLYQQAANNGEIVDAIRAELDDLNRRNKVLMRLAESEDPQAIARFFEIAEQVKAKTAELKAAEAELAISQSDPGDSTLLAEVLQLSTNFMQLEGEERLESRIRLSSLIRRIVPLIECHPIRGAYIVLPLDTKVWRVESPTEGAFAFQLDLQPRAVDAPPPRYLFLLKKNPTDDARDAFYQGKGGQMMTADGIKGFPSPNAFEKLKNKQGIDRAPARRR